MKRLLTLLFTLALTMPAYAGSAWLKWNPVSDADLAGYEVAHETATLGQCAASPSQEAIIEDVGNNVEVLLTNLPDCTAHCFWVRAYDQAGQRSQSWSNAVDNWANPSVTAMNPATFEVGGTFEGVAVSGANFRSGMQIAAYLTDTQDPVPGVVIDTVTAASCNSSGFNISIAQDVPPGTYDLKFWLPESMTGECCDTCNGQCVGVYAQLVITNEPPGGVERLRRFFRKP